MAQHIGIDFDNTIVTYDRAFYKYALRMKLVSPGVKRNKQSIRDAIRLLPGGNDKWTELQGLVYGKHMDEANPMPGIENFLKTCKERSIKVSIISHKTLYPFLGPRINLHLTAKQWFEKKGFLARFGLALSDVIFEETLKGKLRQISLSGCSYFIDDLVEVLAHPDFPKHVQKILYGSPVNQALLSGIKNFEDWNEIKKYFFG